MRLRDRILWPLFERSAWLEVQMPRVVDRIAIRAGHLLREVVDGVAQRTPIVRTSYKRWGEEKLRQFRIYIDGLVARDVQ